MPARHRPSLRNIFKELENETGTQRAHNDLTPWAQQGVLLLNTVLTVEQGRAFAHAKQGWETFTKAALEYAVQQSVAPLAAVLWGKPRPKVRAGVCRCAGPPPRAGAGIGPPQPAFSVPWVLWVGTLW